MLAHSRWGRNLSRWSCSATTCSTADKLDVKVALSCAAIQAVGLEAPVVANGRRRPGCWPLLVRISQVFARMDHTQGAEPVEP